MRTSRFQLELFAKDNIWMPARVDTEDLDEEDEEEGQVATEGPQWTFMANGHQTEFEYHAEEEDLAVDGLTVALVSAARELHNLLLASRHRGAWALAQVAFLTETLEALKDG